MLDPGLTFALEVRLLCDQAWYNLRCCNFICHYFQQPLLVLLLVSLLSLGYTQLKSHTWCFTDLQVELMIQVLVNLLGVTVLSEKPSQHAQSAHPQDLGGQTCLTGTPALTCKQGFFTLRRTSTTTIATMSIATLSVKMFATHRSQCVCPWLWPPVHALPWL